MTTEYEKFLKDVEKQEKTAKHSDISVGMKDGRGSLLIIGGRKEDLWKLASGLYAVGNDILVAEEAAIEAYNKTNGSHLPLNYISKVFDPMYEKHTLTVKVPSRSNPGEFYIVKRNLSNELSCNCPGFLYRKQCWHTEAVSSLLEGKQ